MLATVERTEAEIALERQFLELAPRLMGDDKLRDARAAAMAAFGVKGLPHRRIEEWKYTDLRTGLVEAFPPAERPMGGVSEK
ncbi:MAG: Fe-S cluster assembly protein SufD, partial [Proteobacteria bacterium]|nr:Fe-S cluster assembly protein SufD [Pseudomonadota bacterium]